MANQIRSVAQSCLTLCDPMNRSTAPVGGPHGGEVTVPAGGPHEGEETVPAGGSYGGGETAPVRGVHGGARSVGRRACRPGRSLPAAHYHPASLLSMWPSWWQGVPQGGLGSCPRWEPAQNRMVGDQGQEAGGVTGPDPTPGSWWGRSHLGGSPRAI